MPAKRTLLALAKQHGTPLFIVDHAVIRRNYATFRKYLPRVQVYYAVKANPDPEIVRTLPRRGLPVAVLAWLGVHAKHQGRGVGGMLLAHALRDCDDAGKTFAFVAVILDCVNDKAKSFYQRWDFAELPGHPYRLFLDARTLAAMMKPGG
jgi:GNAT superfamily N-acetyltransferase